MGLFSRIIATTLPLVPRFVVGRVASRYVAGDTLEDAVHTVQELNRRGARATIDHLGEEVKERQVALDGVEEYLRIYDAIDRHGLEAGASVKLTAMGLEIDEAFCRDNVDRIAAEAARRGRFLRIDMEDRTTTDATVRIYNYLQERHGAAVGIVFQAYMRRLQQDIDALPPKADVRICEGIYIEPREVAWKGFDTVRLNFVAGLEKLIRREGFVGIATHDEYLICASLDLLDRYSVPPGLYEFQMLLGVEQQLRDILLGQGHGVRIYVPYGRDWYEYSIRRLRENPEVAKHVIRATLSGN